MQPKYIRMIKAMASQKRRKKKGAADWIVYILRCADESFYTGITNNISRRVKMHQQGKASKYTRSHGPVELVYQEVLSDRGLALVREYELKRLPRLKKEMIVDKYVQKIKKPKKRKEK